MSKNKLCENFSKKKIKEEEAPRGNITPCQFR